MSGQCVGMISLLELAPCRSGPVARGGACEIITFTHMAKILYNQLPHHRHHAWGGRRGGYPLPPFGRAGTCHMAPALAFTHFLLVFLLAISRGVPVRRHDPSTSMCVLRFGQRRWQQISADHLV